MRILYVAMKYDYGDKNRGLSFEHWNFYHSLSSMGHDLIYFDFLSLYQELGFKRMNHHLWDIVKKERPNLLFCVLYQEQLDKEVIRRISEETDTITLNWFSDDHWRFDDYSRYWAPCFNWVVTTAKTALPKYAAINYRNVIKSQWGFNHFLYRNLGLETKYDVTFVGLPHGNRRDVIEEMRNTGINVQVWGNGWELGRLEQDEMIKVFNQSRINLNLSNASIGIVKKKTVPSFISSMLLRISKVLNKSKVGRMLKSWRRSLIGSPVNTAVYHEQIKARNFEVPGCGGFMLTGPAENLEDYFDPSEEIIIFNSVDDLIEKVHYYLAHSDEREAIAASGYERALRDHAYQRRFNEIFNTIGLIGEDRTASHN